MVLFFFFWKDVTKIMIKISTVRRNFYLIFFNVVLVATRGKNTLILHLHVSTSSVWTKNDPLLFHEKNILPTSRIFLVWSSETMCNFTPTDALVIFYDYLRSDQQVTSVTKYGILYISVVFIILQINWLTDFLNFFLRPGKEFDFFLVKKI